VTGFLRQLEFGLLEWIALHRMFSYGSSARVGVGRRGPGGREYKPPKDRKKDPSKLVPPPLKHCDCMIQLDLPEYAALPREDEREGTNGQTTVARRLHLCFEGATIRERTSSLRTVEQALRSGFGVHLVVPGRKQTGPVAVAGKSYRETIPAVDYLLQKLVLPNTQNANDERQSVGPHSVSGRILRNVKDPSNVALEGRFFQQTKQIQSATPVTETNDFEFHLEPYWMFENESWNILACPLEPPTMHSDTHWEESSMSSSTTAVNDAIARALRLGLDNFRFRLGNAALSELDIILAPPHALNVSSPKAFAAGNPTAQTIQALYQEIQRTRVVLSEFDTKSVDEH